MYAGNSSMDIYVYSVEKNNTIVHDLSMERTLQFGDVFPLKRCRFLDVDTKCPRNPQAYFDIWYKGDMTPQRKCKQGRWVDTREWGK